MDIFELRDIYELTWYGGAISFLANVGVAPILGL